MKLTLLQQRVSGGKLNTALCGRRFGSARSNRCMVGAGGVVSSDGAWWLVDEVVDVDHKRDRERYEESNTDHGASDSFGLGVGRLA
jgi:hypothetical protein